MVSTLKGPIPPHQYYDREEPAARPAGRTRPEAQGFALKGQGSLAMLLQIEGQGMGPSGFKQYKVEPKDHVKENVRRMRHIQKDARKRQEEGSKPVKALWQSSKYEAVPSKVKEVLETGAMAPRPTSAHSYLRAHSRTGWAPISARAASTEPPEEKLTIPRAETAREARLTRHNIDFIKANGRAVKHSGMRRSPSLTALDDLKKQKEDELQNYQMGEVPHYLSARQKQWKKDEERRIAMMPDPDLPAGHRVMPDAERRDTLFKLESSQKDLLQQLACLPIRTDTFRVRSKKQEIENKLMEIEEAIRIFSRPKVFVRLDD